MGGGHNTRVAACYAFRAVAVIAFVVLLGASIPCHGAGTNIISSFLCWEKFLPFDFAHAYVLTVRFALLWTPSCLLVVHLYCLWLYVPDPFIWVVPLITYERVSRN
jgi:hypothetical protein